MVHAAAEHAVEYAQLEYAQLQGTLSMLCNLPEGKWAPSRASRLAAPPAPLISTLLKCNLITQAIHQRLLSFGQGAPSLVSCRSLAMLQTLVKQGCLNASSVSLGSGGCAWGTQDRGDRVKFGVLFFSYADFAAAPP